MDMNARIAAIVPTLKPGYTLAVSATSGSDDYQVELRKDGVLAWRGWTFEPDFDFYLERELERAIDPQAAATTAEKPVLEQVACGIATMQAMCGIADWRVGFVVYQNMQRRAAGESLADGEFGLWMAYEQGEAQLMLEEIDETARMVHSALVEAAAATKTQGATSHE